jgi:hypothetical protein
MLTICHGLGKPEYVSAVSLGNTIPIQRSKERRVNCCKSHPPRIPSVLDGAGHAHHPRQMLEGMAFRTTPDARACRRDSLRIQESADMIAGKFWATCSLLLISSLALADGGIDGKEKGKIEVTLGGNSREAIRLEARQAPLRQVVDEIAGKTGTRVHYSALPDQRVTATCSGTTAQQILQCLLGPEADLMSRYPSGLPQGDPREQSAEIWVLESSFEDRPFSTDPQDSGQGAAADIQKKEAGRHQTNSAQSEPEEIGKLVEMAAGKDPAQRAKAIARLATDERTDEATFRNTLENALLDENAEVRAQAVYGLARHGGAGTLAMLQAALHDSDADVRLMAVDSAGTDAEGLALLREALADSDETVRTFAALKLEPPADSNAAQR